MNFSVLFELFVSWSPCTRYTPLSLSNLLEINSKICEKNLKNKTKLNKMKRYFFILLLSLYSVLSWGQTLEDFFIHGTNEYVQLNKEQRTWLLKRHKENKKEEPTLTIYQGKAEVVEYKENNLLTIKTSTQGNFSLKRWDLGPNGVVFGMCFSVCSPVCDGWIKFISPQDKLPITFPKVKITDFADSDTLFSEGWKEVDLGKKIEIPFYHYEFTEGDTIKVYNNSPQFLSKENQSRLSKFWKRNVINYLFKDGKIEKQE